MKKIFIILLPILLLVMGCSGGKNLIDFDHTKLKEEIKEQSFQPKLPSNLPFDVEEAIFTPPPKEQQPSSILTFDFFGPENESGNKDHLSLMTVKGGKVESDLEYEDVKIGDLKGKYALNDGKEMILNWIEDDVYYVLTFYVQQSDTKISKEDLIKTAKSFE
ncbi:DUF4367 domain-containing protein [Metabacillus litoralis]|uniref:DUF4367 domain-containing protein n=1 Tax=Metabacillus litoralis TaxID=152268 RepID=UPI001CFF17ED|nr:DUF4367 domain-containing protein [Metabacillus litoralis]